MHSWHKKNTMIKLWEEMANEISLAMKEMPEDLNCMINEMRRNSPILFMKLGLIGSFDVKYESAVAVHRFGTWGTYDMPVFKVTPDLFASLLLTDPKNVLAEDIKLPYKAFLIRVPDGFWKLQSLMDGEIHKIPWIWVHEYLHTEVSGKQQDWWRIDSVSEDGTCITYFDRKPEYSLDEFLNTGQIINSPLYTEMSKSEEGISYSMRRLMVNLCLYLSEVGDIKKKKSYKKFSKSKRRKRRESTVLIVGSNIKISKNLIELSKSWVSARQGNRSEWRIKKRFAVRGHWRNQACGKNRKLRKKIWIAPHWKGPGKGKRLPRIYDVN